MGSGNKIPGFRAKDYMLCICVSQGCIALMLLLTLAFASMYMAFVIPPTISKYIEATRPFVSNAADSSLSILSQMNSASYTVDQVLEVAKNVSYTAATVVTTALNRTDSALNRLEALSRNPVLRLSLGN